MSRRVPITEGQDIDVHGPGRTREDDGPMLPGAVAFAAPQAIAPWRLAGSCQDVPDSAGC